MMACVAIYHVEDLDVALMMHVVVVVGGVMTCTCLLT